MKIVIAGGRNFNPITVVRWLDGNLHRIFPDVSLIIHGACGQNLTLSGEIVGAMTGADLGADMWCRKQGFPVQPVPAEWARYGNSAGPIRNGRMFSDFGPVGACILFPGDNGTRDCGEKARAVGIEPHFVGW